ncbi:MAG: hypothetical protein A2X61_14390 [Ignavibacteria bacterium GWB2_35_12]|nr:MAG: hypothetical protein A2X63_04540 [Ignavibacteria bacterium GWA2_35_8]OGU41093.1 MAG: hypothetical protein A2X61_14390 [Ignavibacteria bacterium GWB2_35_12]OGU88117.1 MAG: hypothetical protein A2220_05635 [Ignavibacteria bacterium RIFOXYA2_FULL_35_10]OGV22910.1 MAG: hypothetical protein A2475_10555 [Ignavibacteria bacterium RIFOXYC2_FULL_35_21]
MGGDDCEYIENELEYELLMKAMPRELYELVLWRCLDYKIEEIADGFKVSKKTIQRRFKEAKEYAKALLLGLPPPEELIKIKI